MAAENGSSPPDVAVDVLQHHVASSTARPMAHQRQQRQRVDKTGQRHHGKGAHQADRDGHDGDDRTRTRTQNTKSPAPPAQWPSTMVGTFFDRAIDEPRLSFAMSMVMSGGKSAFSLGDHGARPWTTSAGWPWPAGSRPPKSPRARSGALNCCGRRPGPLHPRDIADLHRESR